MQATSSINDDAQAAILLWRVVQQGRENPLGRVEDAMREPVIGEAGEDAVEVPDLVN